MSPLGFGLRLGFGLGLELELELGLRPGLALRLASRLLRFPGCSFGVGYYDAVDEHPAAELRHMPTLSLPV